MSNLNYEYPISTELRQINPEKIVDLTRERPTFSIFPMVDSNAWTLEWEMKDNYMGLQQLRGINGEPSYVKMVGGKRFSANPGVYGEYMTLDEKQMTLRAADAAGTGVVNVTDLVLERQDYLNNREIDLIEYIHWKILLDAQFTFVGPTGAVYGDQFTTQTATFSDWSDHDNATPIADLLGLKTLQAGKSVSFGAGSMLFINQTTESHLLQNKNQDDLGGQLAIVSGGVKPFKTLGEINSWLMGSGLPTIVVYDEGYNSEPNGDFVRWIPDDRGVLVGRRTNGDSLGEYRMVRNAQNPNMAPGRYEQVIDRGATRIPRTIEVHRGHNGGPVLFYGSAIVRITM